MQVVLCGPHDAHAPPRKFFDGYDEVPDLPALSVMNDLLRRMVRRQHECEGVTYRL